MVVDSEIDYGAAGLDDYARDLQAEGQLRSAALKVLVNHGWDELEPHRSNGGLVSHTLEGLATVDFVRRGLPALERTPHVRVLDVGRRPVYKELTEAPELTVTTVESDKNDWFDLGLMITVGDRRIPYADILRALSAGQKRMLMSDKTYVSLDQPLFHQLRSLIEEANMLKENPKDPLRITRYQVNLWDELAGLATEVSGTDSWYAAISGLATGSEKASEIPVPDTVDATLRPYQVDGFRWLASLWRQGLGGILADDMGLGKTLQVITLLVHMRQAWMSEDQNGQDVSAVSDASAHTALTGGAGPVLVVAPTSVVPNWLAELRRFAPGVRVAGVRDTQAKAAQSLAEVAAHNDVVVTSYTLFRLDSDVYHDVEWSALILDEAQFVKNKSTKAHQTARELKARVKFAITGTPLENNLMELWALLAITSLACSPRPVSSLKCLAGPSNGWVLLNRWSGCAAGCVRSCCAAPRLK
ncbi:DEAD/DEAH box helicase [Pseudoglutamicibacter albus]|uniref:DEAD/DEAH box helicase n=1 Tax=Pseudoglutamicibacter albus TaxID=98671 RepID=UPI00360BF947